MQMCMDFKKLLIEMFLENAITTFQMGVFRLQDVAKIIILWVKFIILQENFTLNTVYLSKALIFSCTLSFYRFFKVFNFFSHCLLECLP